MRRGIHSFRCESVGLVRKLVGVACTVILLAEAASGAHLRMRIFGVPQSGRVNIGMQQLV